MEISLGHGGNFSSIPESQDSSMSRLSPVHYHVWTRSLDGAEYGNVVVENISDASVTYFNIARHLADPELRLAIEDVIGPLSKGQAVFAGRPGFFILLAGCTGGCISPTWN